jgi:Lar family restriction alleviation protein
MSDGLKDCPFCGGGAVVSGDMSVHCAATCEACGATVDATSVTDVVSKWNRRADIAQAPAPVRVKPLVWREEYQKWSADSYTATATGVGCTYIIASSMNDPNHDAVVDAKKAAAQADYEARILAALEAPDAAPTSLQKVQTTPDAGVVAELVEAAKGLKGIVEEIRGVMEHGTWRDEKGQRLKDTPEWVTLYNALAKLGVR